MDEELERKMNNYSRLYDLEYKDIDSINDDIVDHIHNKLDVMNYEEKLILYKNIITEKKLNEKLLYYELLNYKPKEKINILNKLINKMEYYLNRYMIISKIALLEDNKWRIYTSKTNDYKLGKNEVIFENSVSEINSNVEIYIDNLIRIFNNLTDKYIISHDYVDYSYITWVIIHVKEKKN